MKAPGATKAPIGKRPMSGEAWDNLNGTLRERVQAMINASGGRISFVSGYRSVERQQQLWNAAVKKYGSTQAARKWVAPPGKSNHNHGNAVDLGGDYALMKKLAPQFGLRAPMSWEPWHWELIDGESNPDGHTDPPDDHQPADNFSTNISTLASMFGVDIDVDSTYQPGTETNSQAGGTPAKGDNLSVMVDAARKAGFTGEGLKMAVAIGLAEGSRTGARNVNKDKYKSVDRGWWQWNSKWHPEVSDEEADDPYASAKHVYRVTGGGKDWSPWSTYKGGQYKKYLGQAGQVIGDG